MNLFQLMTVSDWISLGSALWASILSIITIIWYLGRGRIGEQLEDTPAAKLRNARLELEISKAVKALEDQNRLDHLSILAQIPSIAEHKASAAMAPAMIQIEAMREELGRLRSGQETARQESRDDINRVYQAINGLRDSVHPRTA